MGIFSCRVFSLFSYTCKDTPTVLMQTHSHTRDMLIMQSPLHLQCYFPCHYFILFILQAALDAGVKDQYGLNKRVEAVSNVRKLTKLEMKLNDALPHIKVDPETYTVTADGEVLTCTAATTVPLSRNYFLF